MRVGAGHARPRRRSPLARRLRQRRRAARGDPLLPLIAASFGTTPGGASAVITGFALAYGLLQLVNGPIADRIGKYRMVFWVTAISAVGNLPARSRRRCRCWSPRASPPAPRWAPSCRWRWPGSATPFPTSAASRCSRAFSSATCSASRSPPRPPGFLGERYGWQAMFFLLSGLYALTALLLLAELRRNPLTREARAATGGLVDAFHRMAVLARRPWVRAILVTVFAEGVLLYGATRLHRARPAPALRPEPRRERLDGRRLRRGRAALRGVRGAHRAAPGRARPRARRRRVHRARPPRPGGWRRPRPGRCPA